MCALKQKSGSCDHRRLWLRVMYQKRKKTHTHRERDKINKFKWYPIRDAWEICFLNHLPNRERQRWGWHRVWSLVDKLPKENSIEAFRRKSPALKPFSFPWEWPQTFLFHFHPFQANSVDSDLFIYFQGKNRNQKKLQRFHFFLFKQQLTWSRFTADDLPTALAETDASQMMFYSPASLL